VRDPAKARALEERGVRVRRGDFDDPRSLAHSFEGASQVLVVSANALGDTAVRLNRTAIEAAKAAGARRILYTSHMGSSPDSLFPPMHTHAETEAALQELGVSFTSLRNGFYLSSAAMHLQRALDTGELAVPEDGPVAWAAHADLAEVAALALTTDDLHGMTPALTGAEALDMGDLAAITAELTGRPIRRVVVPDADFHAGLLAAGLPEPVADLSLGMFVASRRGEFAPPDPTLARLLGREPTPVRDALADELVA
jgi:uncharacterized protein YbjT (DUF2867 family)